MPFYTDYLYPLLVDQLGDPPPIESIRKQIIPRARGDVLEIGAGSGANFAHYAPASVNRLYALEPNPGMVRLAAKRRVKTSLKIEFIDLPGERIPLPHHSIDTVVSTFTLCTISDIEAAIQGIARVLKPDGSLIFFELGLAPDPDVQRWQERLEPICRHLFQGLYLTRNIPSVISQGGFRIMQRSEGYLAQFPKSLSYCWWGMAAAPKQS